MLLFIFAGNALGQVESISTVCLAKRAPNYNDADNRMLMSLTEDMLVDNRFRLFSYVFSMLPADGYPITFESDGGIGPGQFEGAGWKVRNNELLLLNEDQVATKTYKYNGRCNSLTSTVLMGEVSILMEIAIVGPAT
ncbi:MAG: hypothetical protein ACR2QW_05150 [bacterium]